MKIRVVERDGRIVSAYPTNTPRMEIEQSPISMKGVAMSADLVESGAISGKMLKDLYDLCFERGQDFPAVYEKEKPQQITDTSAIERKSLMKLSPPIPSSSNSIAAARKP